MNEHAPDRTWTQFTPHAPTPGKKVCFYFHVHQPWRLRKYGVFDIKRNHEYYDEKKNREVLLKVAKKCYLPANRLMLDLIKRHPGQFKVAYSVTGVIIEQFEKYYPEVLESFKDLAATGQVEFIAETYHHSLAFLHSKEEFFEQVRMQEELIQKHFRQTPKVFRNTELIFNNELAWYMGQRGYQGILAEGADHILQWRSPNYVYTPKTAPGMRLLLKNYKLSDDIAFRFGNKGWSEYPLTAPKFAAWVDFAPGECVNFFMDYETFGEHQWADTGIFNFMRALPAELLARGIGFTTPSEETLLDPKDEIDIHNFVSWADIERDLSAWRGNKLQDSAAYELYKLEPLVKRCTDPTVLADWRKLQTSDHFYYMCIKYFSDGDVHKYFNPYDSPYDGFIIFMNVLQDLISRIERSTNAQQVHIAPGVVIHHIPQINDSPTLSSPQTTPASWSLTWSVSQPQSLEKAQAPDLQQDIPIPLKNNPP